MPEENWEPAGYLAWSRKGKSIIIKIEVAPGKAVYYVADPFEIEEVLQHRMDIAKVRKHREPDPVKEPVQ